MLQFPEIKFYSDIVSKSLFVAMIGLVDGNGLRDFTRTNNKIPKINFCWIVLDSGYLNFSMCECRIVHFNIYEPFFSTFRSKAQ